jgi:DNA gyrase/topoisomerase IV subunit B
MATTNVTDYVLLDEIDHVRKRTGMYAGSTELTSAVEWVYDIGSKKMIKSQVSYIPALIKIFSEILDNAIDEHRRAPAVLDSIRVDFSDDGTISVTDNGRGIPVELHPQTGKYIAETVFSNLRAGSNFNDDQDQQLIGTNGVGSTLTNILSTQFHIESCDGKKLFKQDFFNGMRDRSEPKVTVNAKNYTRIAFTPDYAFFKLSRLDDDHKLKMTKKIADASACNPGVKFYVNGDRINVKDFGDYIALYDSEFVYDDTPDWKVGISYSDGFEQVSFVNSVETYQGGTHVFYVMDQITDAVRDYLRKKHKVEVKPADIRTHMRVYISANINRPKFSSQTKENLISQPSTYKTSWSVPDFLIKKLVKSPIIQHVLDWVQAKAKAAELAELRKLNKEALKTNPKRVDKFDDAIERKDRNLCELYMTEGDCIQENTLVLALTDEGQKNVPIRKLQIGDLVLTHQNRFRPVTSITSHLKESITISYNGKTLIVSPEHRLMVYHNGLNQFGYLPADEIDPQIHMLVENKIVSNAVVLDDIIHIEEYSEEHLDGLKICTNSNVEWIMSKTHRLCIFDYGDMTFKIKAASDLTVHLESMVVIPDSET